MHFAVLESGADLIAGAVERCEHLGGELASAGDDLDGVVGGDRSTGCRGDDVTAEDLAVEEFVVGDRRDVRGGSTHRSLLNVETSFHSI